MTAACFAHKAPSLRLVVTRAILTGCCLAALPAIASAALQFVTKWGSQGSANGQFREPSGLVVGAGGNLYVADRANHRIQVFSNDGAFVSTWGDSGVGNGQFNSPRDVAVDANGQVYVTDFFNDRVQVFSSTGTYLRQWGTTGTGIGQFKSPRGIVVDDSFHVFVSEDGFPNKRVQKFTSTGVFIATWGTLGTGNGQFQSPRSVTVNDSNQVYVVDTINNRVQKFTSTGQFLVTWGSMGAGNGQFQFPGGLAVSTGQVVGVEVFVVDTNNHRVQMFGASGAFQETSGSQCRLSDGSGCVDPPGPLALGDGQFYFPLGIAIDHTDGDVFVSDSQNHRIQKFSSTATTSAGPQTALLTTLLVSPNPTRGSTWIRFGFAGSDLAGARDHRVSARVYDSAGRLVQTLYAGTMPAGDHALDWDGTRVDGDTVPPGVYFVDVRVDDAPARSVKIVRLP